MTHRSPLYGLLTSYFVSQVGTAASGVAIPWLVLVTTGSAGLTGLVGFAEMLPYVVVQSTSGPLADRLGLHRTTVLGNALAAVLVCAIPALSTLATSTLTSASSVRSFPWRGLLAAPPTRR